MTATRQDPIAELLARNLVPASQVAAVEEAIKLIKQMRALGLRPKGYDLVSPFDDKAWLHKISFKQSR